jgi:hypothetical protein
MAMELPFFLRFFQIYPCILNIPLKNNGFAGNNAASPNGILIYPNLQAKHKRGEPGPGGLSFFLGGS